MNKEAALRKELEYRGRTQHDMFKAIEVWRQDAYEHGIDGEDFTRALWEWTHQEIAKVGILEWMHNDPSIKINTVIEGELLPPPTPGGRGPGVIESEEI